MTGFGRAAVEFAGVAYQIEVRSVNHRHLDVRVRLPRSLSGLEADLKSRMQQALGRGKVDMNLQAQEGLSLGSVQIDLDVAAEYARAAQQLGAIDGVEGSLSLNTLMGLPGVAQLSESQPSTEELAPALIAGVDTAIAALQGMREAEGEAIARDLLTRVERVDSLADSIEKRAGVVRESVIERLRKRAEQLQQETGLVDEARLQQEVVIAADRLDITEEIVRLRSHIAQFREIVAAGGVGNPVGRRLDFLLQEFGREANTIGSKGSDAPIAHEVVELKTELERIREQVQNVE
jgi:uncharacterized protein (TIGR00255 family)